MPFALIVATLNLNPETMTQREADAVRRHARETGDKSAVAAWNAYCDVVQRRIDARKASPRNGIGDAYVRLWGG